MKTACIVHAKNNVVVYHNHGIFQNDLAWHQFTFPTTMPDRLHVAHRIGICSTHPIYLTPSNVCLFSKLKAYTSMKGDISNLDLLLRPRQSARWQIDISVQSVLIRVTTAETVLEDLQVH